MKRKCSLNMHMTSHGNHGTLILRSYSKHGQYITITLCILCDFQDGFGGDPARLWQALGVVWLFLIMRLMGGHGAGGSNALFSVQCERASSERPFHGRHLWHNLEFRTRSGLIWLSLLISDLSIILLPIAVLMLVTILIISFDLYIKYSWLSPLLFWIVFCLLHCRSHLCWYEWWWYGLLSSIDSYF